MIIYPDWIFSATKTHLPVLDLSLVIPSRAKRAVLGQFRPLFSSHNGLYPDISYFETPWFKSFSGMRRYEVWDLYVTVCLTVSHWSSPTQLFTNSMGFGNLFDVYVVNLTVFNPRQHRNVLLVLGNFREWSTITSNNHPIPPFLSIPC